MFEMLNSPVHLAKTAHAGWVARFARTQACTNQVVDLTGDRRAAASCYLISQMTFVKAKAVTERNGIVFDLETDSDAQVGNCELMISVVLKIDDVAVPR